MFNSFRGFQSFPAPPSSHPGAFAPLSLSGASAGLGLWPWPWLPRGSSAGLSSGSRGESAVEHTVIMGGDYTAILRVSMDWLRKCMTMYCGFQRGPRK